MIRIKFSFIVAAVAMTVLGYTKILLILFLSVTAHELTHVITAKKFGAHVEGINIAALGEIAVIRGLDRIGAVRRLTVYAAGPLLNLAVCAAAHVISIILPFLTIVRAVSEYNLFLFMLNMLPIFPLDGGRIAQIILGYAIGTPRANKIIILSGKITGIVIFIAGMLEAVFFSCNISLVCIGYYIFRLNKRMQLPITFEFFQSVFGKINRLATAGSFPVKTRYAHGSFPVRRMVDLLGIDFVTVVLIDGPRNETLHEKDLLGHVLEYGINGTIGELLQYEYDVYEENKNGEYENEKNDTIVKLVDAPECFE